MVVVGVSLFTAALTFNNAASSVLSYARVGSVHTNKAAEFAQAWIDQDFGIWGGISSNFKRDYGGDFLNSLV